MTPKDMIVENWKNSKMMLFRESKE